MPVALRDILAAEAAIRPYIRTTPILEVSPRDFGLDWGGRLTLKLEQLQHAGSFKPRGAFTSLLTPRAETRPVVAVSGGNHGAAVGYAARELGLHATVFVPEFAPQAKIDLIKSYGAEVRVTGAAIADTIAAYEAYLEETGARELHPYAAEGTVTGQGTLGLEWAEQAPDMDAVLVAIGGGGLISGVAAALAAGPAVIGVEPRLANCAHQAREAGAPVASPPTSIARDSLGAPSIGDLNHQIIGDHVDEILLVEDDAIREAQSMLWSQCGIAAELGASTALAALISGVCKPEPGAHMGVLICGSNLDPASIQP